MGLGWQGVGAAILLAGCAADFAGPGPDAGAADGGGLDASVDAGAADDGGLDASVDAGPLDAGFQAETVWTNSSAAIDVTSFGFWAGSAHYQRDRADLSAAQLRALAALRTIPTPAGFVSDSVAYVVTITEVDGGARLYRASQYEAVDSDEPAGASQRPTISWATFGPFTETFQCLSSRSTGPSSPRALSLDPGCFNLAEVLACRGDFRFVLAAPGRVAFVGSSPGRALHGSITVPDGGLMAESGAPLDGGVFRVDATLDAGTWALEAECLDGGAFAVFTIRALP
jgi:hypothetical protein